MLRSTRFRLSQDSPRIVDRWDRRRARGVPQRGGDESSSYTARSTFDATSEWPHRGTAPRRVVVRYRVTRTTTLHRDTEVRSRGSGSLTKHRQTSPLVALANGMIVVRRVRGV